MANKLNGFLNLTKIPKDLISETKKGDKGIYIDIVRNKNGVDQYGNVASIQLYNKATKETIYLGNLKEIEFGGANPTSTTSAPSAPSAYGEKKDDDLPF